MTLGSTSHNPSWHAPKNLCDRFTRTAILQNSGTAARFFENHNKGMVLEPRLWSESFFRSLAQASHMFSTCCSPFFILVLQIVNPLDSRLAKNFATDRQFWSIEFLWILHVTAGRVELLLIFRFVEKLRMVWCSIPGNLLTFSSARPVSEDWCQFFHVAGLTLVTMPCCRAVVLLCQANAWSWASKSEKLKRQRWFMRCSAEPHSRAAPYWTLTSLLTTRLAMMPSPLESQKTLRHWWIFDFYFIRFVILFWTFLS